MQNSLVEFNEFLQFIHSDNLCLCPYKILNHNQPVLSELLPPIQLFFVLITLLTFNLGFHFLGHFNFTVENKARDFLLVV